MQSNPTSLLSIQNHCSALLYYRYGQNTCRESIQKRNASCNEGNNDKNDNASSEDHGSVKGTALQYKEALFNSSTIGMNDYASPYLE
eukprot:scaffold17863_cov44-Attheya_sp.AAC.2